MVVEERLVWRRKGVCVRKVVGVRGSSLSGEVEWPILSFFRFVPARVWYATAPAADAAVRPPNANFE